MELKHVKIDQIIRNQHNPRGIDIPTQDQKLPLLKDSISAFGVMVPVVLTPKRKQVSVGGRRTSVSCSQSSEL